MCAVSMRVRFAKMYWLGMTVCGRIAVESGSDLLPFCGTLLGSASLTRNYSHGWDMALCSAFHFFGKMHTRVAVSVSATVLTIKQISAVRIASVPSS